jgi:hypothetical protein
MLLDARKLEVVLQMLVDMTPPSSVSSTSVKIGELNGLAVILEVRAPVSETAKTNLKYECVYD